MSSNVAFVVIYNHNHEQNIELIERLYRHKFSHIYHVIPFYTGVKKNVVTVYEQSLFFQGYFSYWLQQHFNEKYEHYIFIADDMLLNPAIDESNYKKYFRVSEKNAFIHNIFNNSLVELHTIFTWNVLNKGSSTVLYDFFKQIKELPTQKEALQRFEQHGLRPLPSALMPWVRVFTFATQEHVFRLFHAIAQRQRRYCIAVLRSYLDKCIQLIILTSKYLHSWRVKRKHGQNVYTPMCYPLAVGWSDIVVIPSGNIKLFCHYCSIFSACNIHAEVAIPTALVLSNEKISVHVKDKTSKGAPAVRGREFTPEKYEGKISVLLADFPTQALYLHPIKLSAWQVDV